MTWQSDAKTVPSSSIPLDRPIDIPTTKVNLYQQNSVVWQQKSEALLADFKYGWNIGKFGSNSKLSIPEVFKRLSECITMMITYECGKKGQSSESFISHFNILSSTMLLIAREVESKKIPECNALSFLATLQGFINSCVDNNQGDGR